MKIVKVLAMFGVVLHELCHLFMCIITHSPVKRVSLIKRFRSEEDKTTSYFGEVVVYENKISFLQSFLISFAPLYLSFWIFFYLLNFLINNQVSALIFFLSISTMISLVLSAAPSSADIVIIPRTFQNDTNHSMYQILLILFSILTTWIITFAFSIQFVHEIFIYLVIAAVYFAFKYSFKLIKTIYQLVYRNHFENYRRPKKIRFKRYRRRMYKPKKYNKDYESEKLLWTQNFGKQE